MCDALQVHMKKYHMQQETVCWPEKFFKNLKVQLSPCVMAKWYEAQIPPFNFLDLHMFVHWLSFPYAKRIVPRSYLVLFNHTQHPHTPAVSCFFTNNSCFFFIFLQADTCMACKVCMQNILHTLMFCFHPNLLFSSSIVSWLALI